MAQDELAANNSAEVIASQSEDLPQETTESYGTGVQQQPELNIGQGTIPDELAEYTITTPGLTAADEDAVWHQGDVDVDEVGNSPVLTGGDIDAAWEQAAMVGDEAVGGTVGSASNYCWKGDEIIPTPRTMG